MTERGVPSPRQPDPDDSVNPDLTTGVGAEDLDEERVGLDPLEEGMDPPENWSGSDRFGISAEEQREGESLDQRLAEEIDDFDANEPVGPGVAEGAGFGTDEETEIEQLPDVEEIDAASDPTRQSADEAGGSVAHSWRTPESEGDAG